MMSDWLRRIDPAGVWCTWPEADRVRVSTWKRLQRVGEELQAWDEFDAASLAPDLFPQIDPPFLSRASLTELRDMLVDLVSKMEGQAECVELAGRRN